MELEFKYNFIYCHLSKQTWQILDQMIEMKEIEIAEAAEGDLEADLAEADLEEDLEDEEALEEIQEGQEDLDKVQEGGLEENLLKCMMLFVINAEKNAKFHLNLQEISLFFAEIALDKATQEGETRKECLQKNL